jgi:Flp pilus assembly protein TadD
LLPAFEALHFVLMRKMKHLMKSTLLLILSAATLTVCHADSRTQVAGDWLAVSDEATSMSRQAPSGSPKSDKVAAAKALYKAGDIKGAIKAFQELDTPQHDNVEVQAWLGFLFLQDKRPQEAIPPLEVAAKARPNDLEVNTNLGGAYLGAGNPEKALTQYQYVEKLSPKLAQIPYNIGTIYLQLKRYPEAANAFQRAITLDPKDAFSINNLGIALERVGQKIPAAETYTRASNLSPGDANFARNAGLAWYVASDYSQAVAFMVRSRQDGNKDVDLGLSLADAYTRLQKRNEALLVYKTLVDSQKGKAPFWFNVAVLESQVGNLKNAEEAYRKALSLDPNDLDTLNNLAMMLYKKGSYSEAETLFDRLSGLNNGTPTSLHNLAAAATKAGDQAKAISAWKAAIKANPSAVQDRLELANLYLEVSDVKNAAYNYSQVLLLEPNNYEALNGMGIVDLRSTKLSPAESYFRRAIHANVRFIPAYNNLALTLEKENHRPQAIVLLKHAAKLAPQDLDVQKNLQRMLAAGS